MEGVKLGKAIEALKVLLRWRDGVPCFDVDDQECQKVPALSEKDLDTVVVPLWIGGKMP